MYRVLKLLLEYIRVYTKYSESKRIPLKDVVVQIFNNLSSAVSVAWLASFQYQNILYVYFCNSLKVHFPVYLFHLSQYIVSHTIFFLLGGQKMDLFVPNGAIKSTLWPASRKTMLRGYSSLEGWKNQIFFYFILSKYNIRKMCGRKDLPWL